MKPLLSILLAAALILCATASAQTIRTLGFNATNGVVVANTGTNVLTFGDAVNIAGILIDADGVFYGAAGINFDEARFIGNSGIELFNWGDDVRVMFGLPIEFSNSTNAATTRANLGFSTNLNTLWTATNAANARTNLSLGLPALTNTSNVTAMRALAGSTNTNEPYTGQIEYLNHSSNTMIMEIQNGIVVKFYEQ